MGRTRRLGVLAAALTGVVAAVQCTGPDDGACVSDADGITGGSYTFDLSVDDTAFTPIILKAENLATVTVTLKNTGTRPHDFVIDCIPVAHEGTCPATSCFPDASTLGPVAPDASATTTFLTPNPEGIYDFHSTLPGDTQAGQFVVQ